MSKVYYLAKELAEGYANETEPKLYPDKYMALVPKEKYDEDRAQWQRDKTSLLKAVNKRNKDIVRLTEQVIDYESKLVDENIDLL